MALRLENHQLPGPPPNPDPPFGVGDRVLYGWPREDYNQYTIGPGTVVKVHAEGMLAGLIDVRFEWQEGFIWTLSFEPQWGFVRAVEEVA